MEHPGDGDANTVEDPLLPGDDAAEQPRRPHRAARIEDAVRLARAPRAYWGWRPR